MAPCVPQTWGTGGTFHQGNKANLRSNLGFAGNYTKVRTGAAYICSPQAEPPGFSASLLSIG
ncbi:hypothetical protein A1F99_108270 [Pyrenophora tritici-repentis]|nr:hypothetical protein A1F99_108270 [Pyrenophora tritici-repentis]